MEGPAQASACRLGGADRGPGGGVHAEVAGAGGGQGSHQERHAHVPGEVAAHAHEHEDHPDEHRQPLVLGMQEGTGTMLDSPGDLLHLLVALFRLHDAAVEAVGIDHRADGDGEGDNREDGEHGG